MGKNRIEDFLPRAYEVIKFPCIQIAKKNDDGEYEVQDGLKGQIAAFGASVNMGNLKSAIAFFSEQGGSKSERHKLMKAIYLVLHENKTECDDKDLFESVKSLNKEQIAEIKEKILDAAIALKLAFKMYKPTSKKNINITNNPNGEENEW